MLASDVWNSQEDRVEDVSGGVGGRGLVGWLFGAVGNVLNMLFGRAGYYNRYLGIDVKCVEEAKMAGLCKPFGVALIREGNSYRVRTFTTRKLKEVLKQAELAILIEDYGTAYIKHNLTAELPKKWACKAEGRYFKVAYIYKGKHITTIVVDATFIPILEKKIKCLTYQQCLEKQFQIYRERDNTIASALFEAAEELPRDKWFISLTTIISRPKPNGTRTLVARVVAIDREAIWTITKTAIRILTQYDNLPKPVKENFSTEIDSITLAYKILGETFRKFFTEGKTEFTITLERYGKQLEARVKIDKFKGREIPVKITLKYDNKTATQTVVCYLGIPHDGGPSTKEIDPIALEMARKWARRGAARHWKIGVIGVITLAVPVRGPDKWTIYTVSAKVSEVYQLADKIERLIENRPLQRVNLDQLLGTIKEAETRIYYGVVSTDTNMGHLYAVVQGEKIPVLPIGWLLDGSPLGENTDDDYRRFIGLSTVIASVLDGKIRHIVCELEEPVPLTLYEYRKLMWLLLLSTITAAVDRDRVATGIGVEDNFVNMYVFLDNESIEKVKSKLVNYVIFNIKRKVENGKAILTVKLIRGVKQKEVTIEFVISNLTMRYFMPYGGEDIYIKKSLQAPLAYKYYLVRLDQSIEIRENTVAFPRIPQVLKIDPSIVMANYGLALTTREELEKLWELFKPS